MNLSKIRIRVGKGSASTDLSVKQAGQIIVIFMLMLTALIGMVGIAIDVTFAWRSGLQIQRAADASAMAGVVYLPGDLATGQNKATAIASANGYINGSNATVVANPAPTSTRQLDVTITANVPTFFVRIFGINNWTVSRTARAAYVLPVPMGSPLSYLGVGCFVLSNGASGFTTPQTTPPPPTCMTTGTGQSGITDAGTSGGTSQGSLGAFGAAITKGGDEGNGDAYLPANNPTGSPSNNVLYDPSGYYYTVVLPAGGNVQIFDPGFCAMGGNGKQSYWGTGDHWIGTAGTGHDVSTYYTLWNTNGLPLIPSGWTKVTGDSSGTLFEGQLGYDPANGAKPGNATATCDSYHNKWWTLSQAGSLGAGTYEVQVSTTDPADSSVNTNTSAENNFAIQAVGGGTPTVYGYDKMAVYNNLMANNVLQQFYLAKVDQATGAGKSLTIDLFDVGDSTAGTLQILSPNGAGGTQTLATFYFSTFSYTAATTRTSPGNCVAKSYSSCSGTVSAITVAGASGSSYNNTWIEITIPLPSTYGSGGLWQGGWWQIQYNVSQGNDTTTWSVNVNGNPVHLMPWP